MKLCDGFRLLVAGCLVSAGCALPPHLTNLHHVHEYELGRARKDMPSYRCTIGAHRGSSGDYRENTLAALQAAEANPRYAFVEFDVQFTLDEQIILFHDQRLFRLFGKLDKVRNTTYAELVELSGGEIIRYTTAMDLVRRKKVNIEIKSHGDDRQDERLADALVADVVARGREREVMFSSISGAVVRYINRRHPGFRTGQIFWLTSSTYVHLDVLTERLYERFNASAGTYLMLHVANLRNIEDLLKFKPRDKTIVFWDFDDRIYLVHKDPTDRLWGMSSLGDGWERFRFLLH